MWRAGAGAAVMTASTAGLRPYGGDLFYPATKRMVAGLHAQLACASLGTTSRRTDPSMAVLDLVEVPAVVADARADEGTGRALVCYAERHPPMVPTTSAATP